MDLVNLEIGILGAVIIFFFISIFIKNINNIQKKLLYFFIAFLIAYPYKIGDDVFSIFGGVNPSGSVYSILAIYQNSGNNSESIMGLGYQKAKNDVENIVGITVQKGNNARQIMGITIQKAETVAIQELGIAVQISNYEAFQGAGITLQITDDAGQVFGFAVQDANNSAFQFFGIVS